MPLTLALGEAFQFDWSEGGLLIGGLFRRIQVSHMKLCASRAFWLVAYPSQGHVPCERVGQWVSSRLYHPGSWSSLVAVELVLESGSLSAFHCVDERPQGLKAVCQDFASLVPSTSRMLSTTLLSLITSFSQPSSGMLPHLIARSIR